MLFLSEQDVRALLPMPAAIDLVADAFAGLGSGAALNQPRRRLILPSGSVLHQMAGACGPYFGTKFYSTNRKHGAWFLFALYRAEDGRPLALLEANHLGQIRTGAASGYATRLLAAPDADTVGLLGSGFQARTQLEALAAVRPLRRARVWSRSEANRQRFAVESAVQLGIEVEAAATAEDAVRGASIVVTATNAKDPVLEAAWVAPEAHINAIGSNQANRRELPAELIAKAALIAVDSLEQARIESGDLILSEPEHHWDPRKIVELAGVSGKRREGITIFKSNGLGVQDVAVAGHVYEQALKQKRGKEWPMFYS
jgi:alanine dehydrogenase